MPACSNTHTPTRCLSRADAAARVFASACSSSRPGAAASYRSAALPNAAAALRSACASDDDMALSLWWRRAPPCCISFCYSLHARARVIPHFQKKTPPTKPLFLSTLKNSSGRGAQKHARPCAVCARLHASRTRCAQSSFSFACLAPVAAAGGTQPLRRLGHALVLDTTTRTRTHHPFYPTTSSLPLNLSPPGITHISCMRGASQDP